MDSVSISDERGYVHKQPACFNPRRAYRYSIMPVKKLASHSHERQCARLDSQRCGLNTLSPAMAEVLPLSSLASGYSRLFKRRLISSSESIFLITGMNSSAKESTAASPIAMKYSRNGSGVSSKVGKLSPSAPCARQIECAALPTLSLMASFMQRLPTTSPTWIP